MTQTTNERIWGWAGIALELDISESTAKRWARTDPVLGRIVWRWRGRVFAYASDLASYRHNSPTPLIDSARPLYPDM